MADSAATLSDHQKQFVDFLLASGVLTFGDFTTKSGRKTPYFVNTGNFNDGQKISSLGNFYAQKIIELNLDKDLKVVFGPAYKGIPLAVTTAAALSSSHNINVGFSFDRKEEKDHGDGGSIVGRKLSKGDKIILVEDVVTAGTTIRAMVPVLREVYGVEINDIVISVDRCEKGKGSSSAISELQADLGVTVNPIVTIHEIRKYLSENAGACSDFTPDVQDRLAAYLEEYGA